MLNLALAPAPDPLLFNLPDALQPAALARWDGVTWRLEPGEAHVELIAFETTRGRLTILRQVWWFDEESQRWVLDENTNLALPSAQIALLKAHLCV